MEQCVAVQSPKGSSTIEFALVFPFLVLFFLAVVLIGRGVLEGNFTHYLMFKKARSEEVQRVHNETESDNAIRQ